MTEWYCGSGSTCCSVPDTSEDGERLWGCIDAGETCSRSAYLFGENMGFEVTDDGYGEHSDNGDDDGGARGSAASLPAVISVVIVIGAVMGM